MCTDPLLAPLIEILPSNSLSKSGTSSCVKRERKEQGVCSPLINLMLLLWVQSCREQGLCSHTLWVCIVRDHEGLASLHGGSRAVINPCSLWQCCSTTVPCLTWIHVNFWKVTADLALPHGLLPQVPVQQGKQSWWQTLKCALQLVSTETPNIKYHD